MIPIILPSDLTKDVKNALKNGTYSQKEVSHIYQQIQNDTQNRNKGWKRAGVISIVILALLVLLSLQQMSNNTPMQVIMASMLGIIIVILLLVKYFYVDRVKRQFIKFSNLGNYDLS